MTETGTNVIYTERTDSTLILPRGAGWWVTYILIWALEEEQKFSRKEMEEWLFQREEVQRENRDQWKGIRGHW